MARLKRENRLQVRMSDAEIALLRDGAEAANMTMSDFARFLLLSGAQGILSQDEQHLSKLLNSTGTLLYSKSIGRQYLPGLGRIEPKKDD